MNWIFYHNVNIYICKLLVHRKVVTVFDFLPFKFYSNCIPSLTWVAAAGLSGTEIETADISIANKRYFNSFYEKLLLVLEDLDWEWCHHLQRWSAIIASISRVIWYNYHNEAGFERAGWSWTENSHWRDTLCFDTFLKIITRNEFNSTCMTTKHWFSIQETFFISLSSLLVKKFNEIGVFDEKKN